MSRFTFWGIGAVGILVALSLGGCAAAEIQQVGVASEPFLDTDAVISPLAADSRLRLLNESDMVAVGESVDMVFEGSYRRPEGSTAVTELPSGFEGNFRSTGWQTYRRTFSVLAKDDRVILALDHREKVDADVAADLVNRYVRQYGMPLGVVESETSKYRFWQDGSVRLMLLEFVGDRRGITAAVGLTNVMDRLGMDVDSAGKDAAEADQAVQESQKK